MKRAAVFSDDRSRRYLLVRSWLDENPLFEKQSRAENLPRTVANFLMFNPSDADEEREDATVRKCIGFAKRWGFSSLIVTNLIPFVSSDPWKVPAWSGLDLKNAETIIESALKSDACIAAWGSQPKAVERLVAIEEHIYHFQQNVSVPVFCIGTTSRGRPLHPSRAGYTQAPVLYWPAGGLTV